MLRSQCSDSQVKLWTIRNVALRLSTVTLCALGLFVACSTFTLSALGQGTSEFTLTTTSLDPDAVAPGGGSSSIITVNPVNGFSGSVALSCAVTSSQPTTATPTCVVSPASVTPSATATATISTTGQTTTVGYNVTITGTGPSTTYSAPPLSLTVLAVTPAFTITVQRTVAPSSVPAGSGAQGIVSVNPINGYMTPASGGVTLSCSSISPLVTIAPVCSFSYPQGQTSLVLNGTAATSTLTINTFGPVATGAAVRPRNFYALWLPLPFLGLLGLGAATTSRNRRIWGILGLFVFSASLLLLPACNTTTATSTSTPDGTTPANSYTFTIVGVDGEGVVSSNTGTNSAAATVTLSVTKPTSH